MINIEQEYQKYCLSNGIRYHQSTSVLPYDDSTLFCPAGMQQFKQEFKNESFSGTQGNTQRCLRLNDLDELGDGSHLGVFDMLGFFSFREKTVKQTVLFFEGFLQRIGVKPSYVTLHPDCLTLKHEQQDQWTETVQYYSESQWFGEIRSDEGCVWSDGDIGGYCTEFYVGDLEIGNIVNPLGTCIDVGFGLERLDMVVNHTPPPTRLESLEKTISTLLDTGVEPSNLKQGYVLRRLLRTFMDEGGQMDHVSFLREQERRKRTLDRYYSLKERNSDKSSDWWWQTHGIRPEDL